MIGRSVVALATAAALLMPSVASGACLNAPEAESITLVALPEILRQTGVVCAGRLPASSLLRQGDGPFLAKYDAAADRAWPKARGAIVKLSNPAADVLLGSEYARPLLTSLLVPLLVGRIAQADCGVLDTLVTQLAPLPPTNTAGVVVTALRYFNAEKAKGKPIDVPDLPLCPENAR
ncbi:hypothetical protein SAMN05192583_0801 [Sphingomonas gellani]|uniref:Uncharacterized protein n=2 Tax=Sphingomonas gellani TaxID=1166340 RepID=A0A1H7ZS42_9SPHN|nr:hypothetical protein SAMN05192583_0801 [Sphingomonas gellani]